MPNLLTVEDIRRQITRLKQDFALTPVTASEIEFYLYGSGEYARMAAFWHDIVNACARETIILFKCEKEQGKEQHEIALATATPVKTARDTAKVIKLVEEAARAHGLQADFSAKPIVNEPGNGLHIHVHLADAQNRNVFCKDDAQMSEPLQHAIGGLLDWLPASMPVFAPQAQSYTRFAPGSNAPLTVSWGANNRTVAIRLPDKPRDNKHIEHRVAGADADPASVIAVILAAIHYGLKNYTKPNAQIYGDARLPLYKLAKLPAAQAEAQQALLEFLPWREYFSQNAINAD